MMGVALLGLPPILSYEPPFHPDSSGSAGSSHAHRVGIGDDLKHHGALDGFVWTAQAAAIVVYDGNPGIQYDGLGGLQGMATESMDPFCCLPSDAGHGLCTAFG